jgi:hypothetical protein
MAYIITIPWYVKFIQLKINKDCHGDIWANGGIQVTPLFLTSALDGGELLLVKQPPMCIIGETWEGPWAV